MARSAGSNMWPQVSGARGSNSVLQPRVVASASARQVGNSLDIVSAMVVAKCLDNIGVAVVCSICEGQCLAYPR